MKFNRWWGLPRAGSRIPAFLQVDAALFGELFDQLAVRGQGHREAGAFLLAQTADNTGRPVAVSAVAYYDDLDPHCLTGGIEFGAAGYSALNALCRERSLRVVGDIHTHPRAWVSQSTIDSAHPMIGLRGHVALIAPHYGQGRPNPSDLGVHVYSDGTWTSHFGADAAAALRISPTRGSAFVSGAATRIAAPLQRTGPVLRLLMGRVLPQSYQRRWRGQPR